MAVPMRLLRNLAQDYSQQEGATINSDLRNMLNANPPGDQGDLAAIDILRERDLGIATLNQTREAIGLTPYTSFNQITSDPTLAGELQQVYGSVDQVDLFVGGLAEDPAPGAMVGPTFQAVIADQFENLRDGDSLFFENQGFSPTLMKQIQDTTLSNLIDRDTDTTVMQPDAFVATQTTLRATWHQPNPPRRNWSSASMTTTRPSPARPVWTTRSSPALERISN